MLHISTKSIPVEAAHSMSMVERYHSPLCSSFNSIKEEAPYLYENDALQMAVKAINDSVVPDGLVMTLLVFGAIPRLRLPTDLPKPSMVKISLYLQKATE